jgi:hypothetical protein
MRVPAGGVRTPPKARNVCTSPRGGERVLGRGRGSARFRVQGLGFRVSAFALVTPRLSKHCGERVRGSHRHSAAAAQNARAWPCMRECVSRGPTVQ